MATREMKNFTANVEQSLRQVNLTEKQQVAAAQALQRQRSSALLSLWKQEEKQAARTQQERTQVERQAASAAQSLQRQRSAAIIAQLKQEERETARSAQARLREESRALRQRLAEENRTAREAARAAETLQRQRSAALIAQWKTEQRERVRIAREADPELERSLRAARQPGGVGLGSGVLAGVAGGVTALVGLSAANEIRQAASAWLEYSSKLENTRIAFTTMLGSAQEAEAHLKELQAFALKTPFQFAELIDASQRMQALGFNAKQVIPILNDVGNAVAAAGGGQERLDRVVLALSQMQSKGRVATQEMNQLAEAGIPGWRILEQQLGKSRAELVKMVEQGKISSKVFLDAFQKFSQQNFGGLMERQSRTFTGAMSNIKDALLQTSATAFEPLFKKISEITDRIAQEMQQGKPTIDAVFNSLMGGLIEAAGVAGAAIADTLISKITDPRKWAIAGDDPFFVDRFLRGFLGSLPDIEDLFGIGDVAIPDIKVPDVRAPLAQLKQQQTEVSEASRKAAEMVEDLTLKLAFYGQNTEKAATQQRLLAIGMEALTSAEGKRAIQLAGLIDKQRIATELADQQRQAAEALAKVTEGKYKNAFEALSATTLSALEQIRELNAAERGGLTEIERFNFGLGAQTEGMLDTAQAAAFTKEQILLLRNGILNARDALTQLTSAQKQAKAAEEKDQAAKTVTQFLRQQAETLRELRFGAKTAHEELEDFIKFFPAATEEVVNANRELLRFNATLIDSTRRMKEMFALIRESVGLVPPPGKEIAIPTAVPIDIGAPPPPDIDLWKEFASITESTIIPLNEILTDSFFQLGDAIGQLAHQWVLLGETGPAVMRKILAHALASIAAEAAVNMVKELALGFATLFFNPAESAAHFTSAGLWAAIAGGTALAGRGVAGDTFKQKSRDERDRDRGQSGPSQLNPLTLERNLQPQILRVDLNVKSTDAFVVDAVVKDYQSGGKTREAIINDGVVTV